jgi:hypothetical protein
MYIIHIFLKIANIYEVKHRNRIGPIAFQKIYMKSCQIVSKSTTRGILDSMNVPYDHGVTLFSYFY